MQIESQIYKSALGKHLHEVCRSLLSLSLPCVNDSIPVPSGVRRKQHSLMSFGHLLHPVGLSLSGPLHCGDKLLVCPVNFFLLDGDLLLSLDHLDLDLLQSDLLLLLRCLKLIGQLSLSFLKGRTERATFYLEKCYCLQE